ncbi:hypothetical protein YYC_04795 [Plasmodium yoelii 17X]|uniref:YIR protein n=1 Tax=Plasmodium yoelii 17X TaxID=1323249 RepID=V7PD64_PLAYE|nr:hypothetical protein YYC_04795 [Plasmodium yoelii 17X]
MLNSKVCGEFDTFWKFFSDELNESKEYDFKSIFFNEYCSKHGNCNNDIDKINAGCLWLFNKFYGNRDNFSNYTDDQIDIVVYIMMWLFYKLNQKPQDAITTFNDFYNKHMQNVKEYTNHINGVTEYTSYIDLINKKKELMDISNENVSTFYDGFKILCNMINNANKSETYLEYANKFVDEHQKLFNEDSNHVEGSSYNKILSMLSNSYTNYGNKSIYSHVKKSHPKLIMKKKPKITSSLKEPQMDDSSLETSTLKPEIKISDPDSTSPSSSLVNKLISIPFIFVVTLILLGIAYKYSLFRSRKRSQKQNLREKLKNKE